jgi:hypothetical protein
MSSQGQATQQLCLWNQGEQSQGDHRGTTDPRPWLLDWGKRYHYPRLEFLVPKGQYQGRYGVAEILAREEVVMIPEGYEHWQHCCANGIPEWVQLAAVKARHLERRAEVTA